jgi:zinc transporter ZupT
MILANIFIALSLAALAVTILALRQDIPPLIGAFLGAIMSGVAALNAQEIYVISNGNQISLDPALDVAIILLGIFVINVIYMFDTAVSSFRT